MAPVDCGRQTTPEELRWCVPYEWWANTRSSLLIVVVGCTGFDARDDTSLLGDLMGSFRDSGNEVAPLLSTQGAVTRVPCPNDIEV